MILSLTHEWEDNPIVTTIKSAALPVTALPFPTVTVCPHETETDNWALVEKISNFVKFDCELDWNYPACQETTKLRNDFQTFLQFIVEKFEEVSVIVFGRTPNFVSKTLHSFRHGISLLYH